MTTTRNIYSCFFFWIVREGMYTIRQAGSSSSREEGIISFKTDNTKCIIMMSIIFLQCKTPPIYSHNTVEKENSDIISQTKPTRVTPLIWNVHMILQPLSRSELLSEAACSQSFFFPKNIALINQLYMYI